jgi:hypothetical protein
LPRPKPLCHRSRTVGPKLSGDERERHQLELADTDDRVDSHQLPILRYQPHRAAIGRRIELSSRRLSGMLNDPMVVWMKKRTTKFKMLSPFKKSNMYGFCTRNKNDVLNVCRSKIKFFCTSEFIKFGWYLQKN